MSNIFMSQPGFLGWTHQKNVNSMLSMSKEHHIRFRFIENCSLITLGRSDHISLFLKEKEYDYFLSVDNDMLIHPPGCLDLMIRKLKTLGGLSIIGAVYAKKAHDVNGHCPVNGTRLDESEPWVMDGRLVEMENLPTGFMLVPRDVVCAMVESYPMLEYKANDGNQSWALYNTIVENKMFYSEDFSFCKRARDIGVKIWADTGISIGHVGNFLYTLQHLIPNENEKS